MNGYKNPETFLLSLWMHNDEFLNNALLPTILDDCNGDKTIAATRLNLLFVGITVKGQEESSFMETFLGKENHKIMLEDVGNFNVIAWEELFTNCEG